MQKSLPAATGSTVGTSKIWRFAANDLATLQSDLAAMANSVLAANSLAVNATLDDVAAKLQSRCLQRFDSKSVWRVAIVCEAARDWQQTEFGFEADRRAHCPRSVNGARNLLGSA